MAGNPASMSLRVLAGCSIALVSIPVMQPVLAGPASAVVPAAPESDPRIDFDIPALPLTDALRRFGTAARLPALYRSEILAGQTSTAVRGRYSPEAALRKLLEGTGLTAEKFNMGQSSAFILKAANETAAAPSGNGLGKLTGYPGLVQTRVWQALCSHPLTAPGRYRALLRFQLDETGHVQRARLIGSTGNGQRDIAVLETLRDLRMDAAPPSDIPQPVTMLLLPHDAEFGMTCDAPAIPRAGS
ncbi:TonB family protein [Pandoraea pulmonicola]|uniref:Ferripyoverdine receptor n=1 Tax=Pandoraea pulmonicola TaxID=93221 RepID=A0AAJ4ZG79_PANPU|nr:TonB family protein [Pandoraea pulmonicola]APD13577.1 hypothetical protein RO07_00040 [Pandoraea pulmonicola]SUA92748.1 Ferripyoverdine receptor precursor [Pandoraea pulmonicola]